MEVIEQTIGVVRLEQLYLQLGLRVHEHFKHFVAEVLERSRIQNPHSRKNVHVVSLEHTDQPADLFSGQFLEWQFVEIDDVDPVVHLSWQKHIGSNVLHKKYDRVSEHFDVEQFGVKHFLLQKHYGVHNEAGTETTVTAVDIHAPSVDQFDRVCR